MLNLTGPESILEIASYPSGLMPMRQSPGTPLVLVIKTTKEMILTAKTKREFVFYLVPATVDGRRTYGLITAFFDVISLSQLPPLFSMTSSQTTSLESCRRVLSTFTSSPKTILS